MTDAAKAGRPEDGFAPKDAERHRLPDPRADLRLPRTEKGTGVATRGLSDQTQLRIGNQLKSLYDGILQQPVPDRFRDLIDRLDSERPKTP